MAFFKDVEEIAEAKAEIFRGLEPDGTAILNLDNEFFLLLAARAHENEAAHLISFGTAKGADARLVSLSSDATGSVVEAQILDKHLTYRIGAPGEHLALNSLGALAAVKALGGDVGQAVTALAEFGAPVGRGAQSVHEISGGSFRLIDESYNANPASMAAALDVLGTVAQGRKIAVLGDMLELGDATAEMHRELQVPIAAAGVDLVFCCGPEMRGLFDTLPDMLRQAWATDSAGLIRGGLLQTIKSGDTVMVKGSLGSKMGLIVEAIKREFPQVTGTTTAAA
jgi:UDP-N-acetylmuramoyl-tripeptide--D-alanyl-D-alanine ligase